MAKVTFGPDGMKWHGKVGNGVYRELNGETILQSRPDPGMIREPSPKQVERREITKKVGRYCKRASRDPVLRSVYETIRAAEDTQLVGVINRDAYRPPVVEEIDVSAYGGRPGDAVAVAATDDTGVVRVHVALLDAETEKIEEGEAVQGADGWWLYTAQKAVPEGVCIHVLARAVDRPGGAGSRDVELEVKRRPSRARRRRRRYIPHGGGHPALWGDAGEDPSAGSASPGADAAPSGPKRPEHISDRISENGPVISDRISKGGAALSDRIVRGGAVISDPISPERDDLSNPRSEEGAGRSDLISTDASAAGRTVSTGTLALLDPAVLLREARTRAGLSQRDLAERAGTVQSAISRIERGAASPTVETLLHLLRAAGFRVAAVLVEGASA